MNQNVVLCFKCHLRHQISSDFGFQFNDIKTYPKIQYFAVQQGRISEFSIGGIAPNFQNYGGHTGGRSAPGQKRPGGMGENLAVSRPPGEYKLKHS